MKCPACGFDVPDGSSFCVKCGARIASGQDSGRQALQVPTDTTQMQAGKKMSKWPVIVIIVAIALIAGAVAGILVWRLTSKGALCELKSVKLLDKNGDSLNLEDVPLGKDITVKVDYLARFGEKGSGKLELLVFDGKGEEQWRYPVTLKSSENEQSYQTVISINTSEGETFELQANLKVKDGGKKLQDGKSVSFYVKEGSIEGSELEKLRKEAESKLLEADKKVQELIKGGISADDLVEEVADAEERLGNAKDEGEIREVITIAENIIKECENRRVSGNTEEHNREVCKHNQELVKQKLIEYYDREGTFPNDMSELGPLPACPSGGTYEYYAPDTTPATLSVSCSVHGTL